MSWPPKVGVLLPRRTEPTGIRIKLADYCLNGAHEQGAAKARGFEEVLGISIDHLEHLAREIEVGISISPLADVRDNAPYGFTCAVDVAVRGLGEQGGSVVDTRTVWEIVRKGAQPRLVTAYPKT